MADTDAADRTRAQAQDAFELARYVIQNGITDDKGDPLAFADIGRRCIAGRPYQRAMERFRAGLLSARHRDQPGHCRDVAKHTLRRRRRRCVGARPG
jgi:hypothetical protein